MAYKLIWSPASHDDLRDIVSFISRDSRQRAETFGYRLIAETDKLQNSSEIGREARPNYEPLLTRGLLPRKPEKWSSIQLTSDFFQDRLFSLTCLESQFQVLAG